MTTHRFNRACSNPILALAGPAIVPAPAGVTARFVLGGQDLDRNVKQTATRIAAEVVTRADGRL